MAKRFTDTEIWDEDWFLELPNKYKILWSYIKDKCDNVGIWRPNKSMAQRIIGEPINLDDFIKFVNYDKDRIILLPSGKWFIRDYFVFQYGEKFSPNSLVHKGALKQLVANGVHIKDLFNLECGKLKDVDFQQLKEIAYQKDINILIEAYGNPIKRVKDKEKDKDKEIYNTDNKKNIYLKAKKFSENSEFAIFEDGSEQKLGQQQALLLGMGELKPHDIVKGFAY